MIQSTSQPVNRSSLNRWPFLLALFLALQIAFWWSTHTIRPPHDVVPTPPGQSALHALAFGDDEFYFRFQALNLQNFGDEFGRNTSLRYYDYAKLYQWMRLLDSLDAQSDMLPSLAAYYFSNIQTHADIRYMVAYLYGHSVADVGRNWWWLLQSIYLSMHQLGDMELAKKVAKPMLNPMVPVWAQQMVAVVYGKNGEAEDALRIMNTIRDNADSLSDRDLSYMRYFVDMETRKLEDQRKQ